MIISLTGFMGCGKSSVGKKVSELLCCSFMDLDAVIEDRAGRKIPEIFELFGEEGFRAMERDTLADAIAGTENDLVLALGGGAVMKSECEKMVHSSTMCIYLRATADTLLEHLRNEASGRPLLSSDDLGARINELMSLRSSTYERTAHIVIDTDGKSIEDIAGEICKAILPSKL